MNQPCSWTSLLPRAYGPFARTLLVVLLSLGMARAGHAQDAPDDEALAKVTQLNRQAIEAYQARKFDDAQKILRQALVLAETSGLDQHPIAARTHIHLGIVLIAGAKQRDAGLKELKKALEIQPDITLTKSLVTPDLQKAYEEAKASGSSPSEGGDLPEAPPPPKPAASPPKPAPPPTPAAADEPAADSTGEPAVPATGLTHDPITQGRAKSAIPIIVNVDSSLKFDKLVLAYRSSGGGDFFGREMKQVEPGVYSAEIPARATAGGQVVYYIEAQDKDGEAVAAIGSTEKPLAIRLGAQVAATATTRPGGQKDDGAAAGNDEGDDEDDDEDEDDNQGGSKFFVGILVGSGAGYTTGNGDRDVQTQYANGTIAVAQAGHIAPELGYRWRPDLMLSVQLRYQYITGPTTLVDASGKSYHAANYALAGFAKATWLFGKSALHPFVALAVGGGQIRHVVAHPTLKTCGASGHTTCIDTVSGGPILAGAGAGLMYDLGQHFALVLSANMQVGFPSFTANLDGNAGAAITF